MFAASTIQLVPILTFIILAQRHLIAGLTAGGAIVALSAAMLVGEA